jgi:hypothetical protein
MEKLAADLADPELSPVEAEITQSIEALDLEEIERAYWEQDQFVFVPEFFSTRLIELLLAELEVFTPADVRRVWVPFARKGGAIGQQALAARAPALYALYRSPALQALVSKLSKLELLPKHEDDDHGATLLYYQRKGDYCGSHYDACGCKDGASFTLTMGLIHDTSARAEFELFHDVPEKEVKKLSVGLEPGSLVFFRGDRAYHRVTPLGANEHRVVYSFTFSEVAARPCGWDRFTQNLRDALVLGPRAIFARHGGRG